MNPAIYDTVSVDIETDQEMGLRASGSVIKFNGYLAAYEEKKDRSGVEVENDEDRILPPLTIGAMLQLIQLDSAQSFTKPPPRFTEASLVKELERLGIGRPSTYASIMNKIQNREYTLKEHNALKPTDLGKVICQMLEENFPPIMDVMFTAKMEDQLEQIAEHNKDWKELLREFWHDFIPLVEKAEKDAVVPKLLTDKKCPKCGQFLQKIWSRSKYFYGCANYPTCDFTSPIEALEFNKADYDPNFHWEQNCPNCSAPMTLRHGKYGPFLGCSRYPECKGIVNIPKKGEKVYSPEELPGCPAIGCNGRLTARKSRFGKTFFSCSNYPDCDVIVNALDQLGEKYPNHPKTPYVKKGRFGKGKAVKKEAAPKKKAKASKTAAPSELSPELAAVIGETHLDRMAVTKKLWEYIKEHKLQDPKNKRMIRPDTKLAKVLGNKPIDMMKIASKLSAHFKK
jgi:DNA topoisomerase-1